MSYIDILVLVARQTTKTTKNLFSRDSNLAPPECKYHYLMLC